MKIRAHTALWPVIARPMIRGVGFSGLLLYLWLGVVMAAYSQEWIYTVRPGDNLYQIAVKKVLTLCQSL